MPVNTLFLRLEGPLQAWGDEQSKFLMRRTSDAPTKSGVIGMLCAALGISRSAAAGACILKLAELELGVRIDRPGVRWWDYHTVGAKLKMRMAEGGPKSKLDAMITRREYLCDASFLVALRGVPTLIAELHSAMAKPKWALYLGRKCCPPTRPVLDDAPGQFPDLFAAIKSIPLRRRYKDDKLPQSVDCLLDWKASEEQREAPPDAHICYDVPRSFDPPAHDPRFVIRHPLMVGADGEIQVADVPDQGRTFSPSRPRADYRNAEYRKKRKQRLERDCGLCVFCKSFATTVQHVTYRRAGGNESVDDLCALCRLCHDAVTMIEYGLGMGLDRIDPTDLRWRDPIIKKREEIIEYRSLETRRRRLKPEEVE